MNKIWTLIFFSLLCYGSYSQEVLVLDNYTMRPVPFALVFDIDTLVSAYTNPDGKVRIDAFNKPDTLIFRHSAYHTAVMAYNELSMHQYRVLMNEKIINIHEVVISAGRWEQKQSDVPNRITRITPDKVFFKNPQTVADVLRQSGEVFIQKSQQGGGSPMIRGFSANSLLIVVDGVRMNNAIFRSGNLQNVILLDANVLENIEVVNGPGSVIYGSDAMGGVMNFSTAMPEQGLSGMAFARFSSANLEKTTHVHLNAGNERWRWMGAFTYSDFNDLRSGKKRNSKYPDYGKRDWYVHRVGSTDSIFQNKNPDIQRFSGYSQINITQKARFVPASGLEFDYGFHYTTSSNVPRYDRLIEETPLGQPINAEWYYGPQKWMMHHLSMLIPKTGVFDVGKIGMAYQDIEESRHSRRYKRNLLRSQVENVGVYSFNTDFKKTLQLNNTIFYGTEFTSNQVRSSAHALDIVDGSMEPTDTRYPAGGSQYHTAAGYISWQSFLFPKWVMNTGLRYSKTWMFAKSGERDTADFSLENFKSIHGSLNGNMGMVFKPNESWKLNALISTGFRAPNIDDVGKLFDVTDAVIVVPNPGLKPEYMYNFEAGAQKNISNIVDVGSVAYIAFLHNAMVRSDFEYKGLDSLYHDGRFKKTQALVNTGKAFIIGGSVYAKADISRWLAMSASLNMIKGKDMVQKTPLRHAAPAFGSCSGIITLKRIKAEVDFSYNGAKKIRNMPPDELAKPHLYTPEGSLAWSTLNIYTSYQLNRSLSVQLNVENIFDTHYRPYSSGISAAGRNLVMALKYMF